MAVVDRKSQLHMRMCSIASTETLCNDEMRTHMWENVQYCSLSALA
jgi:hypothetical protein